MQHSPVSPEVAGKLDGALAALATLNSQTEDVAAGVFRKDRGADQKLSAHRARIRETETSVSELQFLLKVAEKADERAEAEQHYQSLQAALETVSAAFNARDEAIVTFCQHAEQAVRAYRDILDKSHAIENLTPPELGMRAGFAFRGEAMVDGRAFPAPLDSLIANELYRFSAIKRPGQAGALPEAKPLSMTLLFNPSASESLSVSSPRVSAFMVESMRARIEAIKERSLKAVNHD